MLLLPGLLVILAVFTVGDAFREAKDEEFPFQVSVQTTDKRHLCGGAIITPRWVLTGSSCCRNQNVVRIVYGSADTNEQHKAVLSEKIEHEIVLTPLGTSRLALIRLQAPIATSATAKQASLPISQTPLRNTTKLSGWKVEQQVSLPPSLYVSDKYFVIPYDCKTLSGGTVKLEPDEFCGMDEEEQNLLHNPGAIVSKSSIALGIMTDPPQLGSMPHIFVRISEHEQWIRDVLGGDAEYVNWVDKVPKDSAPSHCVISVGLLGISAFLLRFI